MITSILLLLFIIPISNGCLVVRFKEPPPCSCNYLLMDSFNTYQIVKDEIIKKPRPPFYQNLSIHPISSPLFSYDECYMSMYCEGEKNLIVFDTDKVTAFGAHSADALCDRYTQKWLVDDDSGGFASYNRLYGFCVDYNWNHVTLPPSRGKCGCSYQIIDSSNALEYLSHYNYYVNTISKYELIKLNVTMDQWSNTCPASLNGCDGNGQTKVMIYDTKYENNFPPLSCGTAWGKYYEMAHWFIGPNNLPRHETPYMFAACFDTNKPLPTPKPPTCNCKRSMNNEADLGPWLQVVNNNIKMVISEDNCRIRFVCRRDSRPQMWINGKPEYNDEYHGTCDPKTDTWRIVTPAAPPAIQTWDDVPIFEYSCVEPSEKFNL